MTRRMLRVALALVVLGAAAPVRAAGQSDGTGVRRRTTYEDLQLFGQVLNQIRVNHPDSIEAHELFLGR